MLIARSLLLSARDEALSQLLAPGEADEQRRMLGRAATAGWFGHALRWRWARRSLMAAERFLLGGIFAHYLARKRWIEREVRRAMLDGIRQVVVVGAGFDALAWRLREERADVRLFEIDHPATQAAKRAALGSADGLHFLPADLTSELPAVVLSRHPKFRADEPTAVIAEGLTMYFDAPRVLELLGSFAWVAGPGGRVIFSFMEAPDDGSIGFRGESRAVGWWLHLRREPFRWGCARTDLPAFLSAAGLELDVIADHRDLRRDVLIPRRAGDLPLARGECLCLCHPSS